MAKRRTWNQRLDELILRRVVVKLTVLNRFDMLLRTDGGARMRLLNPRAVEQIRAAAAEKPFDLIAVAAWPRGRVARLRGDPGPERSAVAGAVGTAVEGLRLGDGFRVGVERSFE